MCDIIPQVTYLDICTMYRPFRRLVQTRDSLGRPSLGRVKNPAQLFLQP